jgi:histidinol-phosphate phosphatase family protein
MNSAIFIDKDGTLVDCKGYPEIIPVDKILENDVLEGLKYLQEKGYKLIIISNQPWIAKGRIAKEGIEEVFKSLVKKFHAKGIEITDYFYCPHQTSDNCECKKPKPKMIFDAAKKHDIDLQKSFFVGDMDKDVNAGKNAGIKTILVKTGKGKYFLDKVQPDFIIENLNAITTIL